MGILKQALSMILNEHKYRPITGKYLSIGKQTVTIPADIIFDLFAQYSLPDEKLKKIYADPSNIDTSTRHGKGFIFDHSLLSAFSSCEYNCLDVSDYEGATIIHDMNTIIPEQYHNTYDFIYDGGCMDNMFDPVTFLKNTSNILKPGGRIVHLECASALAGAYLSFSPEWFFSYYAINGYVDCKVYAIVARESSVDPNIFNTDLFLWAPYFTRTDNYDYIKGCKSVNGLMYLLITAEKQDNSTSDIIPMQSHYLQPTDFDWRKRHEDFCIAKRPILKTNLLKENVDLPLLTDHYKYLGSDF
jgi:SAM-dependent methyltransferase